MSQIRLTKTAEIEKIMDCLKQKWYAMDKVEIVKMAISRFYQEELVADSSVEILSELDSHGIETRHKQI